MTLAVSVSLLSGQSASVKLEKHCSVDELRKAAEAKLGTHLGVLVAQGESRVPCLSLRAVLGPNSGYSSPLFSCSGCTQLD